MTTDHEDRQAVSRPCEDCGGKVVSGLEPFEYDSAGAVTYERSEWCTNLDCPSNRVVVGLHRQGVNDYICLECGEALCAPMAQIMRHRRMHRGQPNDPGVHTYA